MSETPVVLTMDEVIALAQVGPAPVDFSAMGDSKALVFAMETCDPAEVQRLAAWFSTLMCPVVGIGESQAGIAAACDVTVSTVEEAAALSGKINANPVASATLVELLRITEAMPLADALRVESLAYATLQVGAEYQTWLKALGEQPVPETDDGPAVAVEREGDELRLELNRPSNRNAMSVEMRDALNEALSLAVMDESVQKIHISGRGKCFSTGGDLSEFGSLPDVATGHMVRGLTLPGALLARVADKATADVHGACIGSGVEFPAFAGGVTASGNAHFQLPEVGMGLIPGAGGCISIARRIGRQRCAWLALSAKRIRVQQALDWGLVDEIID